MVEGAKIGGTDVMMIMMMTQQNVMDDIPDWSAVEFARAMKVFPNIILEVVSTETPCSECDTYDKIFQQFAVVMNVMNERIPLARVNVGTYNMMVMVMTSTLCRDTGYSPYG